MDHVECTECGTPIERHVGEPGPCGQRWTVAEVRRVRRENGLPGAWRPEDV